MSAPLKLGALLLALASLTSIAAPAMADDDDRRGRGYDRGRHYDRDDDDRDRRDGRYDRRDDRHDRRYDRRDAYRHGYRDGYRHDRRDDHRVYYVPPRPVYRSGHYYAPRQVYHRGPPPWARGRHYRHHGYGPTYVVHDYRPYRLHSPPRGYHWRRSDTGDFLLVAIATGIIADVILR